MPNHLFEYFYYLTGTLGSIGGLAQRAAPD